MPTALLGSPASLSGWQRVAYELCVPKLQKIEVQDRECAYTYLHEQFARPDAQPCFILLVGETDAVIVFRGTPCAVDMFDGLVQTKPGPPYEMWWCGSGEHICPTTEKDARAVLLTRDEVRAEVAYRSGNVSVATFAQMWASLPYAARKQRGFKEMVDQAYTLTLRWMFVEGAPYSAHEWVNFVLDTFEWSDTHNNYRAGGHVIPVGHPQANHVRVIVAWETEGRWQLRIDRYLRYDEPNGPRYVPWTPPASI